MGRRARASLRAALAQDPQAYEARVALLRAERTRLVAGDADLVAVAAPLAEPARAVVEGWSYAARQAWEEVRALDSRLAVTRPNDAVYGDALRLRAAWRVATGKPDEAVAALGFLDLALPMSVDPEDYVQRARAAAVAGDVGTAIESLTQALDSTTPGAFRTVADRVATELAALPAATDVEDARGLLERKIAAFRR